MLIPVGTVLATLGRLGATHLLGIPDNASAPLFEVDRVARHGLTPVMVSREGEAFAIASGLWLGGARPVVVIQNTGLLESGDALRGTAQRMGVPLLCLVGYRGRASLERLPSSGRARTPPERADLIRADIDSAAVLTEPTLRAWGIPFDQLRSPAEMWALEGAWERAQEEERPVAVLLEAGLTTADAVLC